MEQRTYVMSMIIIVIVVLRGIELCLLKTIRSNTAEVTRNNFDQKHGNSILLTYATHVKANAPSSPSQIFLSSEIGQAVQ